MADLPEEPPSPVEERRWRIDRKVSVGLLLALAAHAGAGVWYAARLDARVATVETWTRDNAGAAHRLIAVETKVDMIRELLADRRQAHR